MLRDRNQKQEGKKGTPQSGESPTLLPAGLHPAIVRLLTPPEQLTPAQKRADHYGERLLIPREQWTPAQKRADKREEAAAQAQGLAAYDQVRALLGAGDFAGAVRAITPFPTGYYYSEAVQAVARAQVQAGELLAAVATAQRLGYDSKADVLGAVIQVLLQQGDLVGAQWLAATVTGFQSVYLLQQLAEAQQQAGDVEAARRTLERARECARGFNEGDARSGYFRSYYLGYVVKAQLRLGDLAGATQTAQLIDQPEDQNQAFRLIEEVANSQENS